LGYLGDQIGGVGFPLPICDAQPGAVSAEPIADASTDPTSSASHKGDAAVEPPCRRRIPHCDTSHPVAAAAAFIA
jgi:hypothetical protein